MDRIAPSKLKLNDNNPRFIKDDKFAKLVKSIKDFPEMLDKRPIVVDEQMVVLGGNMRLRACREAGIKKVPYVVAEGWTDEQKKQFIIKDNVGFGSWDWDVLFNEWDTEELEDWGLELPSDAFGDDAIEVEEHEAEEPTDTMQVDVVLGDLIEIGRHRLVCGDSTDAGVVERLMDGNKADMVFTDPPYRIETKGGCRGKIGNSLKKQGNEIEFISNFEPSNFLNVLPLVFDDKKMNAYIFCNKELLIEYLNHANNIGYSYNVLIWKKPNAIPIGGSHYPDIEYILLFRKNAIWNGGLKNLNYSRCLDFNREAGLHPTMKPIGLISNELQISSNKNSIIIDFFLGSGSTMVACEQLNRICYGIELDPKYCQVIINRMMKAFEGIEVKINGKEYHG